LVAGPLAAKLFALYGADVIKVERPGVGDLARRAGPFPRDYPDPEQSGLFLYLNTNKRGLTLDLSKPTGAAMFRQLLAETDLVVEGFRPGTLDRWGLSASALQAINPRLVVCSITNFGQSGPYRDWSASELIFQAMSGFMYAVGEPEREPLWVPIHLAQQVAGLYAFITSLASIELAGLAGQGSGNVVDISIHEAMLELEDLFLTANAYSGDIRRRVGERSTVAYPSKIFGTHDGYIQVNATTEREWQTLAGLLGQPELTEDARFRTRPLRVQHARELDEILIPWIAGYSARELSSLLQAARITSAPIETAVGILESPQLSARGFFQRVRHPVAGLLTYPGAPFPMSATPPAPLTAAPTLGQHNAEIYATLGYRQEDLAALMANGVI
jgi:crotonobetainyl-CoA:carnitine CoA-transferase CaiB-like acyl-CoA transferase